MSFCSCDGTSLIDVTAEEGNAVGTANDWIADMSVLWNLFSRVSPMIALLPPVVQISPAFALKSIVEP
jgi:hypothetical protein